MREIKFRAWSNKHNHMFRVSEISLNRDGYVHGLIDHESEDEHKPDFNNPFVWIGRVDFVPSKNGEKAGIFQKQEDEPFVLMQYTGLKDRNGKEIFEGDIVQFTSAIGPLTYPIEWSDENAGFALARTNNGIKLHDFDLSDLHEAEVIGNIYENPELLKEKTE